MHVGIDITSIIYNRGVSRYTTNLVQGLLADNVRLSLYGSSYRQKKELYEKAVQLRGRHTQTNIIIQSYPPTLQAKLWQVGLNKITSTLPTIDVFHSWDWLQPPDKNLPLVSTIHDLAILKFPETAHPRILKAHQKSWKILKERNAQIITVSRATRKDIIELLGIPAYNIHVIPEALPFEMRAMSEQIEEDEYAVIKNRLKLDKPYIFFVGTREPRKNLQNLINAWAPLAKDVQLLIAGEGGWDDSALLQNIDQENLRFLGKISDLELSVLYSEAELLAYPSLYEGFGLPILEAFHYGTPVVTSNISSMPEVAGNAAELVDPKNVESIRSGITTILNEDLSAQKKRLQRMIIRQQMFDWQHIARETKQVYQKALEITVKT